MNTLSYRPNMFSISKMKNLLPFKTPVYAVLTLAAIAVFIIPSLAQQPKWREVLCEGKKVQLNGLALISKNDPKNFLAVIDSKVVRLTLSSEGIPTCKLLEWKGGSLDKLESLTAVPDGSGTFIAMTEKGKAYRFKLEEDKAVTIGNYFEVRNPPDNADFEGFVVQNIAGEGMVAVWADRGKVKKDCDGKPPGGLVTVRPAMLFWARFDPSTIDLNSVGSREITVPYPTPLGCRGDMRPISDIKIAPNGELFILSAYDSNDDKGPYNSALYSAGKFSIDSDNKIAFVKTALGAPIARFDNEDKKAEALELLPDGGFAVATDDEGEKGAFFTTIRPKSP
jgi:hypothetical protein